MPILLPARSIWRSDTAAAAGKWEWSAVYLMKRSNQLLRPDYHYSGHVSGVQTSSLCRCSTMAMPATGKLGQLSTGRHS
jgi:hypothetical protein